MLAYIGLLTVLSLASLLHRRSTVTSNTQALRLFGSGYDLSLVLGALLILLMIGFRYKVGGDWNTYATQFKMVQDISFGQALQRLPREGGYTLLNWLVGRIGLGFWLVNLACAAPLVAGLVALARQQPNPWLVLVVATPVLIILVGMGYTRQSFAVGCIMFGIAQLINGKSFAHFFVPVLLGSFFHLTSLVFIPIVALFLFKWKPASVLLVIATAIIGYFVVLPTALESYSAGYINVVYSAKGAIFRIVPNAIAGAVLLCLGKYYTGTDVELKIWRGFAILSIVALISLAFVDSSIIVDRLALYLLPMQIVVLSALPYALGRSLIQNLGYTALVVSYSSLYMALWFAYANHSQFWLPYRLYPVFS